MKTLNNSTHISKEDIDETLKSPSEQGKRALDPLKSFRGERALPFNILEDNKVVNDAEVHHHEGDLWLCLEGEVDFICGGEMVDPWFEKNADGSDNTNEVKAKEIKGGTETTLKPGDWLWIPPGEPHQHKCEGIARLVITKVPKS